MEEYLPFLIAMGYAAFKFYSNFKKEQEEAAKRNPGRPAPGNEEGDFTPFDERELPLPPMRPVTSGQKPEYKSQPEYQPKPEYRTEPEYKPRPEYVPQPEYKPEYQPRPEYRSQPEYKPRPEHRPEPVTIEELFEGGRHEPRYKTDYKEPVYERTEAGRATEKASVKIPQRIDLEEFGENVGTLQQRRAVSPAQRNRLAAAVGSASDMPEYNMRDAIIYDAILNRPEH